MICRYSVQVASQSEWARPVALTTGHCRCCSIARLIASDCNQRIQGRQGDAGRPPNHLRGPIEEPGPVTNVSDNCQTVPNKCQTVLCSWQLPGSSSRPGRCGNGCCDLGECLCHSTLHPVAKLEQPVAKVEVEICQPGTPRHWRDKAEVC